MLEGCKRLWLAVLVQALKDARCGIEHRMGHARDVISENARAWFASQDPGIGSFHWICTILEIEPEYARTHLQYVCCTYLKTYLWKRCTEKPEHNPMCD